MVAAGSLGGGSAPSGATGAGAPTGNTLSNGNTVNGTGGAPGPNTSNALNYGTHGTTSGSAKQPRPPLGRPDHSASTRQRQTPRRKASATLDVGILKK